MTLFDIITLACFAGVVVSFFAFTDHNPQVLLRYVFAGVILAVANQIGNCGYSILAAALVAVAVTFIAIQFMKSS